MNWDEYTNRRTSRLAFGFLSVAFSVFAALAADVVLGWKASPSGERVYGYRIYQATNVTGPFSPVLSVGSNTLTATLSVTPGAYYWYVIATNFWQESAPSNVASTPPLPTAVTNLTVSKP